MAATIKTVRANLTFRQSDGLDQRLQRVKLQRAKPETLGDDADHFLILGRIGLRILVEVLILVAFQLLDDAAGDQVQLGVGAGEV